MAPELRLDKREKCSSLVMEKGFSNGLLGWYKQGHTHKRQDENWVGVGKVLSSGVMYSLDPPCTLFVPFLFSGGDENKLKCEMGMTWGVG